VNGNETKMFVFEQKTFFDVYFKIPYGNVRNSNGNKFNFEKKMESNNFTPVLSMIHGLFVYCILRD
jgi:hypothetical protein